MEIIKPILQKPSEVSVFGNEASYDLDGALLKKDLRDTTAWAILQFARVLYPICPFISKKLAGEMGVLDMSWPKASDINMDFRDALEETELLKTIISSIRSTKQCLRLPLGEKIGVRLESFGFDVASFARKYGEILSKMAGVVVDDFMGQTVPVVVSGAIIHMGFEGKINVRDEKIRLTNEITKLRKNRDNITLRLMNGDFLTKASEEVIQENKNRVEEINDKIQRIDYVIQSLGVM
jgi:valyl-tRNA synthetase